jgi:hypothetical protein
VKGRKGHKKALHGVLATVAEEKHGSRAVAAAVNPLAQILGDADQLDGCV